MQAQFHFKQVIRTDEILFKRHCIFLYVFSYGHTIRSPDCPSLFRNIHNDLGVTIVKHKSQESCVFLNKDDVLQEISDEKIKKIFPSSKSHHHITTFLLHGHTRGHSYLLIFF